MGIFQYFFQKLIIGIALNNPFATPLIVNDITLLNPIIVKQIITPKSTEDLSQLIKTHQGPISMGGGKFRK